MPWYEPANRAPPTPKNDEQWFGDEEYNDRWNYPRNQSSDNRRLFFDGFQHEVESRLGKVFPVAAFSRGTALSIRCGLADDTKKSDTQNQNDPPNVKRKDGRVDSKAAQFFHPRPVAALMPYRDFFSPLSFPTDGPDAAESKISLGNNCLPGNHYDLGNVRNTNNESKHEAHCMKSSHDYTQQHQQRLTPPTRSARKVAFNLESSRRSSNYEPLSDLKARQLNDVYDDIRAPFKKPPKQSKLCRGSEGTITLEASTGAKKRDKTWNEYGGRPVDDMCRDDNQREEKSNAKKAKKKGGEKGKKSDEPIDFLNGSKKRPSNIVQKDDKTRKGKSKGDTEKPKKQKTDHRSLPGVGTELEIPDNDDDDFAEGVTDDMSLPKLSESDFAGIDQLELQNAAQCSEGLQEFLILVGKQKHVAFATVFLDPYTGNYFTSICADRGDEDKKKKKKNKATRTNKFTQHNPCQGFECTTSFLPTSKKYCTPRGEPCTAWNCTCDDQLRAMRASATLLGAMFVFDNKDICREIGDNNENSDSDWKCFLLPLGPTGDSTLPQPEVEFARMSAWPISPFKCEVSLSDRWLAFEALLLNERTKLVTYNATTSLLPFYHHLDNDSAYQSQSSSLAYFSSYIAGVNQNQPQPCRNDGHLRSVWDLRLVSWMLRPHATDAELEFSMIQDGFAHLAPGHQQAPMPDMPNPMKGLIDAKNSLELIFALYPIMNKQMVNEGLHDALEHIEAPVQSILASMESRGIAFFPHRLKRIEVQIESRIGELEAQSRSITKDPAFLLSSPQQVSNYLFDVLLLKIPASVISKTTAGSTHRSTSEDALIAIKDEITSRTGSSPSIIDIILEFRQLNKLLTTFVRPLPKYCRSVGTKKSKREPSRIYPQWMQTSVRTGRLSCRKPNLQQVPKEGGKYFRVASAWLLSPLSLFRLHLFHFSVRCYST
jgi:hypothetical protein